MSLPSRYHLTGLYTDIHKALSDNNIRPRDIIDEKSRQIELAPSIKATVDKIFHDHLIKFSVEEQLYLRTLNDATRYFLGDDLMHVALMLNELFPRFSQREAVEGVGSDRVAKFEGDVVISAADLTYNYLAKENPAYLRRLFTSALAAEPYFMQTPRFASLGERNRVMEEMENISAHYVLTQTSPDSEPLKILSMVNPKGKPQELQNSGVERFRYVSEMMPGLIALSSFHRGDSSQFSRFVNLLPSTLIWFLGQCPEGLTTSDEDPVMELLNMTILFSRTLQNNAQNAGRIRQLIHHGHPVYKNLMDLAVTQHHLMSWTFEAIIYQLAQNFATILKARDTENAMVRMLMASGILKAYSQHKGCYIKQ